MTPSQWRTFLTKFSRELLRAKDLPLPPPSTARKQNWMGYRPASERAIAAAELRLGVTLPTSLKSFYRVTNGWRAVGFSIYGIRPVSKIEWLRVAEPDLHQIACEAEPPVPGEPTEMRDYHFQQGTRVKRALLISTWGDSASLLLDPDTRDPNGEWAGGMWASWSEGMSWSAPSFAELICHERKSFLQLRDDKPLDLGISVDDARKNLTSPDRRSQLLGVLALQESRDPNQAAALLQTYRDKTSDGLTREMAIQAACRLKSSEAYQQAIRDLPSSVEADEQGLSIDHGGDEVRPSALFGAILSYAADAAPVIAQWIDAPSPRLRRMAVAKLGHCRKSVLAREKLVAILGSSTAESREAAAFALGQLMDKQTASALIAALKDDSPNVRRHALQALLHISASHAVPAIERLARKEQHPEVRKTIEFVLPALEPRATNQKP